MSVSEGSHQIFTGELISLASARPLPGPLPACLPAPSPLGLLFYSAFLPWSSGVLYALYLCMAHAPLPMASRLSYCQR